MKAELWSRAQPLFDELADLDLHQRAARLAAIAQDDPELAACVRSLLDADEGASGVLERERPIQATLIESAFPELASPGAEAGQRLGPYRLVASIGHGGMGEVFRAERADGAFEQQVAIKLLRSGARGEDVVRRFLLERRILARLNHPHIARLLDGGAAEDGKPYLVMELVEGQPITSWVREHDCPVERMLRLMIDVAEAVDHAHRNMILHRDLKPSNILVNAAGEVKLLDFGIGKLLEDSSDPRLTRTDATPLTPMYAAPEQILGEDVSTATDVYALGVVLYEMLTGQLPHRRAQLSLVALAGELTQDTTERPSAALRRAAAGETTDSRLSLRRARHVDGDIDIIVLAALRREPARRYGSAAAFAEDLRRHLDGRPVAMRPDTVRYRMTKFVRRHRFGVSAAIALLLALLGGLGASLWQAERARIEAARADAAAARSVREAERAERVKDYVLALFSEQDPVARAEISALSPSELIDRGVEQVEREFADQPGLAADLINDLAEIEYGLGEFKRARTHLEHALELRAASGEADSARLADSRANLGATLVAMGDLQGGGPMLEAAIVELRERLGPEHLQVLGHEIRLARHFVNVARADEGLPLMRRVHASLARIRGPQHRETLHALYNVGVLLELSDRLDEAEEVFNEVLKGYEDTLGSEHVRTIYPRNMIADLMRRRNEYPEALALFAINIDLARRYIEPNHPAIGHTLMRMGDLQRRIGDLDAAERTLDEAERVWATHSGPELSQVYVFRARLRQYQGRAADAVREMERAVQRVRETAGERTQFLWIFQLQLARDRIIAGDVVRAQPEIDEACAKLREMTGESSYEAAFCAQVSSVLHEALGDLAMAEQDYARAVELLEIIYGPHHADVAYSRVGLARTAFRRGAAADEVRSLMGTALEDLKGTLIHEDTSLEPWLLDAELALLEGNPEQARASLARAAEGLARLPGPLTEYRERHAALLEKLGP